MATNVLIRPAKPKDIDEIYVLLGQLWPDKIVIKDDIFKIFRKRMNSSVDKNLCAEIEGKVVGYCSFCIMLSFWKEGYIGYIPDLIVDVNYRKQGIGKALMESIIKIASEYGCKMIELDSAFHRERAHKFYESLGFNKGGYNFLKEL